VGVLYELEAVAVTGDDDHVSTLVARAGGEGREDVVGLVGRLGHDGDREGAEQVDDDPELRLELRRGRVATALVLRHDLVSERRTRQVEGDGDA
jgi:hypothetical protein